MFNRRIGLVFVLVFVVMISGAWATATSNSTAQMGWPVSIAGPTDWHSKKSASGASAWAGGDGEMNDDIMPSWANTQVSSYAAGFASGTAHASSVELYESVTATVGGIGGTYEAFADAIARRDGFFVAGYSGWVTASSFCSLCQNLTTELVGETADGSSVATLYLVNATTSEFSVSSDEMTNSVADGNTFIDSRNGALSVSVWFNQGDEGYFLSEVSNFAAATMVPEPLSLSLLFGGTTLFFLRNRRKNSC